MSEAECQFGHAKTAPRVKLSRYTGDIGSATE
jgi:hypothetical protein